MIIYNTLKANKENEVEFEDIIYYVDECYTAVGGLFGDEYMEDNQEYTDFDKLFADYTERQITSKCLKMLKEDAKEPEEPLIVVNKIFFDLDCDGEIAYNQVEELIKSGKITGNHEIREIERKAFKKGYTIKKECRYGENNIYCGYKYLSDLCDEYFPCYAKLNDDYCNNCGNCC